MYKSQNINEGNAVTLEDKFYTCIYAEAPTQVTQPLACDNHS